MSRESGAVAGVRITAFGRSDRGRVRGSNQDRLLVADLSREGPEPPQVDAGSEAIAVGPVQFTLGHAGGILMVADGMGGRAGGARASALAVTAVGEAMSAPAAAYTAEELVQRLEDSLQTANQAILEEGTQDERYRGMGTTATLVGLLEATAYVAQVGDSRAYLARNGAIGRLTRDQSLVQEMIDMGILSEADAENAARNQILQAVGVSPNLTPAHTYHELRRGDVLVLCSDGLSGVVTDAEIQSAVAAAADCPSLCDGLIELANARGGPDNITVLAARIDGDGVGEAGGGELTERQPYPRATAQD